MAHNELNILQQQQAELIRRYRALKEENNRLLKANEAQFSELKQAREELILLQQDYKKIQTANALLGGEEAREQAKRKLTYLIGLIDKALANNDCE